MRFIQATQTIFAGILLAFAAAPAIFAQHPLPFNPAQVCTYDGTPIKGPVYEFASSQATNQMVGRIMGSVGLKPRFEVKAANVPNAAAVIYNNQRYILYRKLLPVQPGRPFPARNWWAEWYSTRRLRKNTT
jgi:hypothetical protein